MAVDEDAAAQSPSASGSGRWGGWSPLPPPGRLRTLSLATLANTVGSGLWLAGGALYLTRDVGLSAASVGAGLTVAWLVGLTASVPLGGLADRRDPRTIRAVLQVCQAAVAASFLLVDSFPVFLVVAVFETLLASGNLAVRAALVAAVGGPDGRVHAFATLRAVANLGIAVGAGLAGFALAADTHLAYQALVVGNAVTYLVSVALLLRLPAYPPLARPDRVAAAPRRGRALRDGRFLAVSGASAVLALQWTVLTLVVPLWTVTRTGAPPAVVSVVLLTNTMLTVLLAVPLSRGANDAARAARAMRRAGLVLAAAMLLYAATGGLPSAAATALLVLATVVYTFGDLWHGTAGAGLAYDLAPPDAVGTYQGADGLLAGLARALGPGLLTLVILDGGAPGWLAVAALFAVTGVAVPALTRRALAVRSAGRPPASTAGEHPADDRPSAPV
ncbi:MFS transporter [Micromonospora globispora]|uniref:MFS transporter n=1 Tax=Micromonospora globispora TaxID=1450148 RepID=A0A317K0N6_9ACTN|nr:MFS transporter [Micromonospora globispora]PWU46629.1 MFS transporter [Micromonospora globispora]RQW82235.1 MFS transporter [Micromonospora globispora]